MNRTIRGLLVVGAVVLGLQLCFPHSVGSVFAHHVQVGGPMTGPEAPDDAGADMDLIAVLSPALSDPAAQAFSLPVRYAWEHLERSVACLLPASGLHPSVP